MPELPEVEIYARYFAEHALGQRVASIDVLDERILTVRKEEFVGALEGRSFTSARRHGKHLFADAGRTWLHLHFGMSGDLTYFHDPAPPPRFARVVFNFPNGAHLAFEDMRLFGIVDLTPNPDEYIREHRLGPDPLDPTFSIRTFRKIAERRRGAIKALLMSQDVIAGVGNLYADETLYQSSIHPRRAVHRLNSEEISRIFRNLRRILRNVIAKKAHDDDYPAKYLIHHREEGARCPRCGGEIRRTVVFGRTTYFCGKHQR